MIKIKIINYKPYEYELLQEKLDILGNQGYITKDLSFISFFKKTNQKQYYKIDFYQPEGETKNDKLTDRDIFISTYRDKDFSPIYVKNNMYVFISNKNNPIKVNWSRKLNIIKHSSRILSLLGFLGSIVFGSLFTYFTISSSIDTFLSYGMTFIYIGFIMLFITMAFRNYFNFSKMNEFNKNIQKNIHHLDLSKLKLLRKIYVILSMITLLFIGGGLIEDCFNLKNFSTQDHPIITLHDIGIENQSDLSTQSHSSFIIPHSYISLEKTNKNEALYIKEYEYINVKKAKNEFIELSKTPSQYGSEKIEIKDNIIYGYNKNSLVSLVILQDQSIITIIPSFPLDQNQANTIIDFYAK